MKKLLLLLIISFNLNAQVFQFGAQAGFFASQRISFNGPVSFDTLTYRNESLIKLKKSNPPALDAHFNYCFTQRKYAGLSFRYIQQTTSNSKNNTYDDNNYYPEIVVKAPAIGIHAGYQINRKLFSYYIEGGLAITRLKFKVDKDPEGVSGKYQSYLNQKNSFLLGYTKAGVRLTIFTIGTRFDFMLADVRNKSGISNISFRPTLNVGMDISSGTIKRKVFKANHEYTQLDDDVKFEEKYEYGKLEVEYGGSMNFATLKPKEIPVIAYKDLLAVGTYQSQIYLKDKWRNNAGGFYAAFKYAPFAKKRIILMLYGNTGQIAGKTSAGKRVVNSYNYSTNSITSTEFDLSFESQAYHIGGGIGTRIRINNKSFMDIAGVYGISSFALGTTDDANSNLFIKQYFPMISWGARSACIHLSYKIKHWGIGLKLLKGLTSPDKNNRLNGTYYCISIFKDTIFKH